MFIVQGSLGVKVGRIIIEDEVLAVELAERDEDRMIATQDFPAHRS